TSEPKPARPNPRLKAKEEVSGRFGTVSARLHTTHIARGKVPHYAVPPARRKALHDVVPGKLLNEPITSNQSRRNSCCVKSKTSNRVMTSDRVTRRQLS